MKKASRRSGGKIMASLILLHGSLAYIMLLAVLNGSLGFLSAIGVTLMGAVGIAKGLGEAGLCAPIDLSWWLIIGLAIGFGVLRGILRYFEQYSNHYIAFRLLAVLRDKIFTALRRLCPAKLDGKGKGGIIAMITADIETLEVFYAHTISPIAIAILVSSLMTVFVGLVASWWLSLVAAIAYLFIGIAIPLISSYFLKESGVAYRKEFASFNSYFLDSIKGIKDIVLHNGEAEREKEVGERSKRLLLQTKRMKRDSSRAKGLTELSVSFFIAASLTVGILLVSFADLDLGRMLIAAAGIFSSFGPVIAVSVLPSNLTQTFASGDRVLNLLGEAPAVKPVEDGKQFEFDSLSVENLSFAYEAGKPVLKGVSLIVKPGEVVGIVGDSGCGKSTLLKLLLRFYEKGEGVILYNGTDVDQIDSASLLDNVTMVSQSTYLFDMSIEDNLRLAKPNASQAEIEEACKQASIHDFILSLPEGYQTPVGTMGSRLSTGEKQRIGLARAFLKGSTLILLDEPTSNVDALNEGMILSSLAKGKAQHSFILVSHRGSTMAIADRVYSIDEGEIAEVR